jgi:hypothetical protein
MHIFLVTRINGCKTFAASIAQTLVDKQVKFQIPED